MHKNLKGNIMDKPMKKLTSLFLLLLLLAGCEQENVQTVKEVVRPIAWVQVEAYNLAQVRRLSGVLQPVESADLSFEVNGKVQDVLVKLGDRVKKGDILARLDTESFKLNVNASKGQLQEAQAGLVDAQNKFSRQKQLYEKGWVAKASFDNAKASLDTAQSAVNVAKARLELSQKSQGDTILKAPYHGTITRRNIEPSQQITANQIAFQIEGEQGLELSITVPETIIDKVEKGQSFSVSFPAVTGLSMNAQVFEVGSQANRANTFPVVLQLEKQNDALRAGMTAEADFFFQGQGRTGYKGVTVKVPVSAIAAGKGKDEAYAFVFDKKASVVRKRSVQTENIFGNDVLISKGIRPGEIIATAGVVFLRDGQQVELLDATTRRFNQ